MLVSPRRLNRPWHGSIEATTPPSTLEHDATCGLCPRNVRANGLQNPDYAGIFVFNNDFPALLTTSSEQHSDALLRNAPETGVCRVICYASEHNLSLALMMPAQIRAVIACWIAQFDDLASHDAIAAVTIFENRGEMMGASNAHPHGQIWATSSVPTHLAREDANQRAHYERGRTPLLLDYLARELDAEDRIVLANDHVVVLVPYWATWPYETLVVPRQARSCLSDWSDTELDALANALSELTQAYDRLFSTPFPYSMGWHQRLTKESAAAHFVSHAHFYPPLLRSATIRKHMVGFELLAMAQRDFTPETAAARLRAALGAA